MTTLTSVSDFVALLEQSQLLAPKILEQVLAQIPALGEAGAEPERLAKSLVQSRLISIYQAQRLLSGRSDGFYIGKYKLLEVLGAGGMGMVFLAENTTMKRLVALKVIAVTKFDRDHMLARFRREAQLVASLSHPNIIQAYDFDEVDGVPFISMEYVEGIDLDRLVRRQGKLPFAQAADFGMQAAAGLEQGRKSGIVHRDIKPANLLVSTDGIVKLLDLGLAHDAHDRRKDSLTGRLDQVGTVDFMAPEQALDSRNVDIRADLYSLGCVLYFVLTQQLPCDGNSPAEKLLKHQSAEPAPIRSLNADVPEGLVAIVHKLLAKRPEQRYQTPAELEAALKEFAERRQPPYDVAMVKYPRDNFLPLLGRSPEPGEINFRAQISGILTPLKDGDTAALAPQGALAPATTIENRGMVVRQPSLPGQGGASKGAMIPANGPRGLTKAGSQPAGSDPTATGKSPASVSKPGAGKGVAKSGIVVGQRKASALSQVITRDEDELEELLAAAPPVPLPGKKKAGSSKTKKSQKSDPTLLILLGGGAGVALLVVGALVLWSMSGSNRSGDTRIAGKSGTTPAAASGTPAGNTGTAKPAPTPAGPPKSPYERWQAYSEQLKNDPDVVLYYTFSGPKDKGDSVYNQGLQPKFGNLNGKVIGKATWAPGRFPNKGALQFHGKGSGEYIALSDGDSNVCNFNSPFSVAVWFQVKAFDTKYNTLIAKGDNAWRLQRCEDKKTLHTAASALIPGDKPTDPPKSTMARIDGLSPMDDGKWHFAVSVYDIRPSNPRLQLYIDGELEGVTALTPMLPNNYPVWIGANAQHAKGDPRNWNGLIDEVLILNRAMTAEEAKAMYVAGRP